MSDILEHLITLQTSADPRARDTAIESIINELRNVWSRWSKSLGDDDARQEVAIEILIKASRYDPSKPVAAWLGTVIGNRCRQLHEAKRAEKRRPATGNPISLASPVAGDDYCTLVDCLPATRSMSEGDPERADEYRRLREAMNQYLSPAEIRTLLLIADGQSYNDVANATGRTIKTVYNHVADARRKLRILQPL
jgi:RNA polymerase sigma factor (sigma-70 family)